MGARGIGERCWDAPLPLPSLPLLSTPQVYLIGGRYWDVAEDDYIFLNDIQILHMRSPSTLARDWKAFVNNEHLSDIAIQVSMRAAGPSHLPPGHHVDSHIIDTTSVPTSLRR
jgi:hypothetical protein